MSANSGIRSNVCKVAIFTPGVMMEATALMRMRYGEAQNSNTPLDERLKFYEWVVSPEDFEELEEVFAVMPNVRINKPYGDYWMSVLPEVWAVNDAINGAFDE
jgi:hypothetical protein